MLVGHTHFDHAVDAPAIARRFGCKAYGSDSLVTLMAPARPRRADGRGRALPHLRARARSRSASRPSVHSKLLLGLAVPYDGDLTCEHLDALTPGAYRCGQVWGISIAVAGIRFYHQGSANLIDDAVRERGVDVFLAGVAGRSFTARLLAADPAPARTRASSSPPTTTTSSARSASALEFVSNVRARRAARGDRRGQRRDRAGGAAASRPVAPPGEHDRADPPRCPHAGPAHRLLRVRGRDRLGARRGLLRRTGQSLLADAARGRPDAPPPPPPEFARLPIRHRPDRRLEGRHGPTRRWVRRVRRRRPAANDRRGRTGPPRLQRQERRAGRAGPPGPLRGPARAARRRRRLGPALHLRQGAGLLGHQPWRDLATACRAELSRTR